MIIKSISTSSHILQKLLFVSHAGLIDIRKEKLLNVMFELDANLVLTLLGSKSKSQNLPLSIKEFVKITKKQITKHWLKKQKYIPINPSIAILELTKQFEEVNYTKYLEYFNDFFSKVYSVEDYDEQWVYSSFNSALELKCVHESITATLEKVYGLISTPKKLSNIEVINKVEELLLWICQNIDELEIIGGPILQVSIYAIAGSPEARRFIKYDKLERVDLCCTHSNQPT